MYPVCTCDCVCVVHFSTLTRNIRHRRGEKVVINVPSKFGWCKKHEQHYKAFNCDFFYLLILSFELIWPICNLNSYIWTFAMVISGFICCYKSRNSINIFLVPFSLQRQVHSISICGGVFWGWWWWISEGGSAWPYLYGRHGLRHGQLLSAGTALSDPLMIQTASLFSDMLMTGLIQCALWGCNLTIPISYL